MIHLTLTGYHAGMPLCPVNKPDAKERGDRFIHAQYFNFDNTELTIDLCAACKSEYDAAMADDSDDN